MLYRVSDGKTVTPVVETTAGNEALLEANLEEWAERNPEILGEELLVIGRQVSVDSGKDLIDLLAIDLLGNLVVVELKRDWIGHHADLQALRYAAMVADWDHATVRSVAEDYWRANGLQRRTFTQELDDFCDEGYEVNAAQRLVLAGRRIDLRLGTMAMWLRNHDIDVRVVTLGLFRDGDQLYLQPQVVIPLPTQETVAAKPSPDQADKEWLKDGKRWHLEEQLAPQGRAILETLIDLVSEAVPEADGPHWNKKDYVVWKAGPKNWLLCVTASPRQVSPIVCGLDAGKVDAMASKLGWEPFDPEAELAEKLASGSNIGVERRGRVKMIIRRPDDLDEVAQPALSQLLRGAWDRFAAGGS